MVQYVLGSLKKSKLTVIALWVAYASSYFIRTCYAASIAAIVDEGIYKKGEVGLIGTAFFICYGIGQLISGLIGDRVNPFAMIIFGLCAGSASCFAMAFANSLYLMLAVWALNGFFQSMLWSPILRIFSETIHKSLQKKSILHISLSLPIGTVCAYLISTVIIKYANFRYVFLCGGVCILFAAVLVIFTFFYIKNDLDVIQKQKIKAAVSGEKVSFMSLATMSGLFVIIAPSFLHGMMRDGITNWVPTMIGETYGVSPSFSVFLTVALPIFNAFGAYAVVPLYKKLKNNEMKTAAVTGLIAVIPTSLLLLNGKLPVFVIIMLLAVTTSIMYALNYLIISLVPVRFVKYSCTSTVSGVLNSAAHIGCAVSSYGFGAVSEKAGWNAVIMIWLVSALLIFASSFAANIKWKGFISKK
ncbi:MAG: MFS transporter [Clostridia bacterium]|nr:MFS transporter [Clostridia bacterium]